MKIINLLLLVLHCGLISAQINYKLKVSNTNCLVNGGNAKVILDSTLQSQNFIFKWSNGSTTDSIFNLSSGNYSVTVFNAAKTDSLAKNFKVDSAATITISTFPKDTICVGSTVILEATAVPQGGSFTWSGGDLSLPRNKDSIHVQPTTGQIYSLKYNNPVCGGSTNIKIVSSPVKAQLAGVTQPTCGLANGSITGAGSAFKATFIWFKDGQPFGTNASILNNLKAGNYTFIIYDGVTGCSDTIKDIILADNTTYASLTTLETSPDSCLNNQGTAKLTVTGGSGNYTFKWSHSTLAKGNIVTNLPKGNYRVTVSDGVCTPFDTAITITGPDSSLAISLTATNDNCSKASGSATVLSKLGTAPYSYVWSNGSTGNTASNLLGNNSYSVTTTDALGCTVTDSIFVSDLAAPILVFLPFDSLCPNANNGVLKLKASGGQSPYIYNWSHDSLLTASTANYLSPGTYTATVTDAGNCTASASVTIAAFKNPIIDLGSDTTILKGTIAELKLNTSLPVTNVNWNPFIQSAENSLIAYAKPDSTTTFSVLVKYGNNGCLLSDSITVVVINEDAEVIVPNIFTPNGDGVNDNFYISSKAIKDFEILIYDRWGNKVYESFDANFKWNGYNQIDGTPLPNGVFTYMLEYTAINTNKRQLLKGSVTLLR